jgi:hypothetical protein
MAQSNRRRPVWKRLLPNERKLQTIASFGEIVSALAVVVSLLYAVYEIRRTQTLSSRDVDEVLFASVQASNTLLIESPILADIIVEANRDSEGLSEAERMRYLAFQHIFFDAWEIAWSYHVDGILSDDSWEEWNAWFSLEATRRPSFGWSENRHHFTGPAFLDHVDAIVTK